MSIVLLKLCCARDGSEHKQLSANGLRAAYTHWSTLERITITMARQAEEVCTSDEEVSWPEIVTYPTIVSDNKRGRNFKIVATFPRTRQTVRNPSKDYSKDRWASLFVKMLRDALVAEGNYMWQASCKTSAGTEKLELEAVFTCAIPSVSVSVSSQAIADNLSARHLGHVLPVTRIDVCVL